ncbi:MAG: hypothetical protein AAGG75_25805, partial [Bacteroidota bacterium]
MFDQSRYHPGNKLIEFFLRNGNKKILNPYECLLNVGEKCNKVYLILEGGFICQNFNEQTDTFRTINFHLDTFHPLMTVLHSYYSDSVSNCQLKAIVKSEVLVLKKKTILAAVEKDKVLKKWYDEETIHALLAINEFHTKLITLSTKDMFQYLAGIFCTTSDHSFNKYWNISFVLSV